MHAPEPWRPAVCVGVARCLGLSILATLLVLAAVARAGGQEAPPRSSESDLSSQLGARVVGLVTHASPVLGGESETEAYLTQPGLTAHVSFAGGRATLAGMLNLEGLTLRRGELNAGTWGEGYVDRRHPHTYLHELMVTLSAAADEPMASVSLGKGFAPFGSDDPMSRPFVKFPANHHLAQILERLLLVGAVRYGPVLAEAGVFNGEEPQSPGDWPHLDRFGDSWAARATLLPGPGVEVQVSRAAVASPEDVTGRGLDQHKWSAAVRFERHDPPGDRRYALVEWALTTEHLGGREFFRYKSVLAEAATRRGALELAARYERTVRPEEERLLDPFRTPRPKPDHSIVGMTRWHIASARVSRGQELNPSLDVWPFFELSYLRPSQVLRPSVFVPAEFYGSERLWSFSVGARLGVGAPHGRIGRYGAAVRAAPSHHSAGSP